MTSYLLGGIYIYPVKSLAGISLQSWPVTATGFKYDRNWMLVDTDGQFLSQRRLPKMALILTALTDSNLTLSAPGMDDFTLPLEPEKIGVVSSTVWHDYLELWAVSAGADEWFSDFLQLNCRLVYQPETVVRTVDQRYADAHDQTSLSDGFPFLLVSDASLAALNQAIPAQLEMARFRPNLVISGCSAYEEDAWRAIEIGSIGFRLPKPCSRCAVPTINPKTAEYGKEPLATLNRLRKWQGKVYFGQNALHDGLGVLSMGDPVTIKVIGAKQPPI